MASSSNQAIARYQGGDWFAVVRQGTVVLLGPDTNSTLINSVWDLLASGPEAHEVLHEVTDAFGVSLSRIPPFGIIDSKDGLRVFLRGDLELAVMLPAGDEHLSGRDVTTWTERRLPAADSYSLRIGPSAGSTPDGGLPLQEGVVRLASLEVVLASAAGTAPAVGKAPGAPKTPDVQRVPEAQKAPDIQRVSDETMIGFTDADLGLTIAPGQLGADAVPAQLPPEPDEPVHTSTTDPIVPALETTTNYDHLWDKTVMRNIEDAAVRLDPESDGHDAPAPSKGDAQPPASMEAPQTPEPATPEGGKPAEDGSAVVQESKGAQGPQAGQDNGSSQGLIDSVPWLRSSNPELVAQPAPQVPAGWSQPPVGPVPVPAPASVPAPAPSVPGGDDSDHDGQTIMKSSVVGESAAPSAAQAQQDATPGNGPSVLARVCSQGHANPPTYPQCAACGSPLSGDAVQVPRPRLGRMRLSTGELIDLDQSLIIGRQPSVSRVQGGTMPRLVQVESPGGDISRSHVEVRLEGWHVMLCDLKATNGTVLIREGQAPRRLAQNEMAILLDGDIAELGDDISLRFEEIL